MHLAYSERSGVTCMNCGATDHNVRCVRIAATNSNIFAVMCKNCYRKFVTWLDTPVRYRSTNPNNTWVMSPSDVEYWKDGNAASFDPGDVIKDMMSIAQNEVDALQKIIDTKSPMKAKLVATFLGTYTRIRNAVVKYIDEA